MCTFYIELFFAPNSNKATLSFLSDKSILLNKYCSAGQIALKDFVPVDGVRHFA